MQGARKISVIFYLTNLINLKFQASTTVFFNVLVLMHVYVISSMQYKSTSVCFQMKTHSVKCISMDL